MLDLKKILVLYNKPLYQQYIVESKNKHYLSLLKAKHLVTQNWKLNYDEHQETLDSVVNTLNLMGLNFDLVWRKESAQIKNIKKYSLIISLGGDGTFLEATHLSSEKGPVVLGVNASPTQSTGALCLARLDSFYSILIDLITELIKPRQLQRLKIKVNNKFLKRQAFNDVLFAGEQSASMARYLIEVGAKREIHKSSGVWFSTAVGSTAGIHSAGGVQQKIEDRRLQYKVRELFQVSNVTSQKKQCKLTGKILPKNQSIQLYVQFNSARLFLDGTYEKYELNFGDRVSFHPGDMVSVLL